jgi:tripartite-type tricarboxylate transporter receptor subunit TctC
MPASLNRRTLLAGLVTSIATARAASAAGYPADVVRFIVGFPPGGGTDVLARLVADGLHEALGATLVVDNKGGASGTIGTAIGAKAKPDGATLILGASGAVLTAPSLYPALAYDPRSDFDPVGTIGNYPNILFVPGASPARSLADLIALSKTKSQGLSYGSAGVGSTLHLSAVLLQQLTGINAVNVPYTSGSMLQADLAEGRLDFAFASAALAQLARAGKIRAIASTGRKRSPGFPDVPTVAEQGFADYEVVNWFFLLAPKGLPEPLLTTLNAALNGMLVTPRMRERLATDLDFITQPSTPAQARALIVAEQDRWAKIIKSAKLQLE